MTQLHGHLDVKSAGSAVLVFWLVWWAWTQFTWALNAANTDHPRVQLMTLLATAVAFLLAVGIPRALGDGALWFAVSYVVLRVIGLLVYYWVAWVDPLQRRAVQVFGLFSAAGLAAVIVGGLLGGSAQYGLWALAIALDLTAAGIGGQLEGWNLHPDHFAERHGLIVIIALGETLIVAASGLVAAPTPAAIATGILAVAVRCGLWWTYFRQATEAALAHPERPLATDLRIALGAGAVLFICGTAAALWRATGRAPLWRGVLVLAAAVAVAAFGAIPAVAMAVLLGALVVIAAVEDRQTHATTA